mgnify:CR=1 FL=1|jgi:hypothetical protein
MRSIAILILMMASGCSSLNINETIAGGKPGSIDYCIKFMGTDVFCVNAERKTTDEEKKG